MTDPIVTKEHEQLAGDIELRNAHCIVRQGSVYFLREDIIGPIALALARIEAQTSRRCWKEGWLARVACKADNPYPQIDEVDDG